MAYFSAMLFPLSPEKCGKHCLNRPFFQLFFCHADHPIPIPTHLVRPRRHTVIRECTPAQALEAIDEGRRAHRAELDTAAALLGSHDHFQVRAAADGGCK
jgi:hypothetical protein